MFVVVNYKNVYVYSVFGYLFVFGVLGIISYRLSGFDVILGVGFSVICTKASFGNFWGVFFQLIFGVLWGYYFEFKFVGLGYRVYNFGRYLLMKVGYSHFIFLNFSHLYFLVGHKARLLVFGLERVNLSCFARSFSNFRLPDVYKGKGINFGDVVVSLKVGKKR